MPKKNDAPSRSKSATPGKTMRRAVALNYEPARDGAPRVIAKGQGKIAEKILKLAREHEIPIREDRNLVQLLMQLDLHQEIPPQLYRAVARILVFVYRSAQEFAQRKGEAAAPQPPTPKVPEDESGRSF